MLARKVQDPDSPPLRLFSTSSPEFSPASTSRGTSLRQRIRAPGSMAVATHSFDGRIRMMKSMRPCAWSASGAGRSGAGRGGPAVVGPSGRSKQSKYSDQVLLIANQDALELQGTSELLLCFQSSQVPGSQFPPERLVLEVVFRSVLMEVHSDPGSVQPCVFCIKLLCSDMLR